MFLRFSFLIVILMLFLGFAFHVDSNIKASPRFCHLDKSSSFFSFREKIADNRPRGTIVYTIQEIKKNQMISKISVKSKKLVQRNIPKGAVKSINEIVGRKAKGDIPANILVLDSDLYPR